MRSLTAGIEVKIAAQLGRANGADGEELGQALVSLGPSGERVEDTAGVGEFIVDVLLSVGGLGVLQPAVRIGDLVTVNGVFDDLGLGFGRSGGSGCCGGGRTIIRPECDGEKKQASKSPEQTAHSWHKHLAGTV